MVSNTSLMSRLSVILIGTQILTLVSLLALNISGKMLLSDSILPLMVLD
jgi:hypothetical protein